MTRAVFIPMVAGALLLAGCRKESVEMRTDFPDGTGTNELVLYDVVGRSPISSVVDYEFHSLVWRVKGGTNWTSRRVISRTAFQGGSRRNRCVNEIGGFDGAQGTALLKVGEESLPDTNGTVHVVYSWREWNLLTNGEVRLVRICQDPFQ